MSVTSNDGRQRYHSFNSSTCTKIKATQKRDDGSKIYNKRPLTEVVEKMESDEGRDLARVERSSDEREERRCGGQQ